MKDLYIFKDYSIKSSTKLPDYSKGNLTFQGFLLANNNKEKDGSVMHLTYASNQEVLDVEKTHASN